MKTQTLLMSLVVMAVVTPLATYCEGISITERNALTDTMLFRDDPQVTFSLNISSKTFTSPLPSPEVAGKQLAAHPGDPHLEYQLAESLNNTEKYDEAKPHYAAAAEGFRRKAAIAPLSSAETAELAWAVERTSDTEHGIDVAERALAAHLARPLPIYRYLSDAFQTVALKPFLKGNDKTTQLSVSMVAEVLSSNGMTDKAIAACKPMLDKGMQYADLALAEPEPSSEDYANRAFYEWFYALLKLAAQAQDQHAAPDTAITTALGGLFQSKYLAKAYELKGIDPATRASFSLLRLISKAGIQALDETPGNPSEATKQAIADEKALLTKLIHDTTPPPAEAYDALALMNFLTDGRDSPEALDAATKALAINPTLNVSFNFVMYSFNTQQKWQEAIDLCHRRLKADDHSEETYRCLGILSARLGKFAEAEQAAREAFACPGGEQNPKTQLLLGSVLLKQGKVAESIGLLESAFTADGTNAIAAYHLAIAYYLTGKTPDTRNALEAARAHPIGGAEAGEFNANVDKLWERITPHDAPPPQ